MASKVSVSEKPKVKVKHLTALKRQSGGSYVFKSTWSVDSSAKQESNKARVEGFDIQILIGLYDVRDGKNAKRKKVLTFYRRDWSKDLKDFEFNLASFKLKVGDAKTYQRSNDFYPGANANNLGIRELVMRVRCINHKGCGEWASVKTSIGKPRKPTISKFAQQEDTGIVEYTITHDKGQDHYENYSTRCILDVYDSPSGKNVDTSHRDWVIPRTETSTSGGVDIASRMGDTYDTYRQVTIKTWSRGLWGPSDNVVQRVQVSWPRQPKINSVVVAEKNTTVGSTYADTDGKVTVNIDTFTHPADEKEKGIINHHPATGVRLEKLVNYPYRKSTEIPGDADWTECGAVDNGICTALSSTVAELRSTPGNYTWIRVKSWNVSEKMFFRYSEPRRMTEIYVPPQTSTTDRATIYSATVGEDGKSAVIGFQWLTDESTGTEISWSDDIHAWESTNEPETFLVTRTDGTRTVSGVTYNYAILYVADLTEGTTYYFRARRYEETEDEPLYGPYCETVQVTPYTSPDSVTLVVPAFVRRGNVTAVSWSFESDAEQKQWELITGEVDETTEEVRVIGTDTYVERTRYTIHDEGSVQVIASGEDSLTGYTLSWDSISDKLVDDDHLFIAVRVDTGGGYVLSDAMLVGIADVPTVSVSTAAILTAQPLEIDLTCDVEADVTMTVSSYGTAGEYSNGDMRQAEGDSVWSVAASPTWAEDDGTFTATVTAPGGLPLMDGGNYFVTCRAIDRMTGISSEEATCDFGVDYAHKATPPSENITVEPYDITDEDGYRTRGATITLASPSYNLAEWFNHDLDDDEYWETVPNAGVTVEDDGWVLVSTLMSSGLRFATNDEVGGTYLVEWRALGSNVAMSLGSETIDTSESTGSAYVDGGAGETLALTIAGGGSGFIYGHVRVSLYNEGYEGVYVPPNTHGDTFGDVYDIFRVTPDGPYLVAEDVALDAVVDDPWAPYGETHYYRVRTRTVDGCEEYADYPYQLAGKELRIDWDGRYLELPYDVDVSDQYEKDFEARRHLDGSVDGYWNQGAVRRGNLKTNIIKARDADKAAALRALGRYSGPCYVRLPDGCAYQADVQLSGIDRESDSFAMAVSISATEVALTPDYMAVVPVEEDDE